MTERTPSWLSLAPEVAEALAAGGAVVALESSLIAQGLPAPHNLDTARAAEAAVRAAGAVPATVAVEDGQVVVGADAALLVRLADPGASVSKAAARDLGPLLASGRLASTTVSATVRVAAAVGIRLMATGGIGGVHRGAERTFDISSDLETLATEPVAVVSSGAKSILDLPATLEVLETRGVPVVGYRTDNLPAFYSTDSGLPLGHRADDPEAAARVIAAHLGLPRAGGLLLVQAPPADVAIPIEKVEAWISAAVGAAAVEGITGSAVTPFVLARVVAASGGRALRANIGLIVANAGLAGAVAVALSETFGGH
jgi:pseudouridine-5'-phosphate glycosidase